MRRRQYAPKPAQDTSVLSSEKLLQTRPFQPEVDNNLQVPSMQTSVQPSTGGFDLTKKVFVDEPQCPQALGPLLQAKLTVGAPNDKYEQEADRVAKQVVQRLSLGSRGQSTSGKDEPTQPHQTLQRETLPDEEGELQMKPLLQRKGGRAVATSGDLESAIHQSRGGGQQLAESIREPMEQAFGGVDFSGVKVHTNAQSDQLNCSIQAKAFTTGQDVFFRRGAYAPGSRGGQELIAHELTHVVQQGGGAVQRSPLPTQRNVVQRSVAGITTLQELLNRLSDLNLTFFSSVITSNNALMMDVVALLDKDFDFPMNQLIQLIIGHGFRHHWSIGNCNGDIWLESGKMGADMHVTGGLGASLSSDVMKERLAFFKSIFTIVEQNGGPEGELQFHPTGAVVTKQLITALALACGSKFSLTVPAGRQFARKTRESIMGKPKRNKYAPRIDEDLLDEYFGYLGVLRGVTGVKIIPTGVMPLPVGIRDMNPQQQLEAINQDMLENTDRGKNRFTDYETAYRSELAKKSPEMVPSLQVFVKARYIPALAGVIDKVIG